MLYYLYCFKNMNLFDGQNHYVLVKFMANLGWMELIWIMDEWIWCTTTLCFTRTIHVCFISFKNWNTQGSYGSIRWLITWLSLCRCRILPDFHEVCFWSYNWWMLDGAGGVQSQPTRKCMFDVIWYSRFARNPKNNASFRKFPIFSPSSYGFDMFRQHVLCIDMVINRGIIHCEQNLNMFVPSFSAIVVSIVHLSVSFYIFRMSIAHLILYSCINVYTSPILSCKSASKRFAEVVLFWNRATRSHHPFEFFYEIDQP